MSKDLFNEGGGRIQNFSMGDIKFLIEDYYYSDFLWLFTFAFISQ
ncbi:unknown protein [Parachlamydia acanthamoebae UV-7]|uniref:Uncharacterized protein n=1 Tax=Parachlamydia acanthamoebae (strain UV7) TaxID=765952 RepID=F8KZW8_PARAV|nr:hypothetical protein [Parachlamydia acanthamoebae]CCB86477.1 unknown protein [Parachlamydia acanthamoebae UV-7]